MGGLWWFWAQRLCQWFCRVFDSARSMCVFRWHVTVHGWTIVKWFQLAVSFRHRSWSITCAPSALLMWRRWWAQRMQQPLRHGSSRRQGAANPSVHPLEKTRWVAWPTMGDRFIFAYINSIYWFIMWNFWLLYSRCSQARQEKNKTDVSADWGKTPRLRYCSWRCERRRCADCREYIIHRWEIFAYCEIFVVVRYIS